MFDLTTTRGSILAASTCCDQVLMHQDKHRATGATLEAATALLKDDWGWKAGALGFGACALWKECWWA
jgi:hypothetical protein